MTIVLAFVNSKRPSIPHSLPIPLHLTPPYGNLESLFVESLIKTIPDSISSAIFYALTTSLLNTAPPNPYSVSFAS